MAGLRFSIVASRPATSAGPCRVTAKKDAPGAGPARQRAAKQGPLSERSAAVPIGHEAAATARAAQELAGEGGSGPARHGGHLRSKKRRAAPEPRTAESVPGPNLQAYPSCSASLHRTLAMHLADPVRAALGRTVRTHSPTRIASGLLAIACLGALSSAQPAQGVGTPPPGDRVLPLDSPAFSWEWIDAGSYPGGTWTAVTVPHADLQEAGVGGRDVWFRTSFAVPPWMQAGTARWYLRFDAVNYGAEVFLNGKRLPYRDYDGSWKFQHLDPHARFEVDATAAILTQGAPNLLEVHLVTWEIGAISPSGKLIAPVGIDAMQRWNEGIVESVSLIARPAGFIEDLAPRPSVSRGVLEVEVSLEWYGGTTTSGELNVWVVDPELGPRPVLKLPSAQVRLANGARTGVTLSAPWTQAVPWDFDRPHLYELYARLDAPGASHVRSRTFGFCEFRVDGLDWYLNGRRVRPISDSLIEGTFSASAAQFRQDAFWENLVGRSREIGLHMVRPHDPYLPERFVEACDRLGLLVNLQMAFHYKSSGFSRGGVTYQYDLDSPLLWSNLTDHIARIVRQYRGHPSVAMWALENEVVRNSGRKDLAARMAALEEKAVRLLDPVRPVHFEGEGVLLDEQGVPHTTIWSQHYVGGTTYNRDIDHPLPHEDYQPWVDLVPAFHGEFGWSPAGSDTYLPASSIVLGDRVYGSGSAAMEWGLAWLFASEVTRNRRVLGLDGQQPFVVQDWPGMRRDFREQHLRPAAAHLRAFVDELDSHWVEGTWLTRTVQVDNLGASDWSGTLRWQLDHGPGTVLQQAVTLSVPAGGQVEQLLGFSVPAGLDPPWLDFELHLEDTTGTRWSEIRPVRVAPPPLAAAPGAQIALVDLDPGQPTAAALLALGLAFDDLTGQDLAVLLSGGYDLLVVGAGSLAAAQGYASDLRAFQDAGGWIVVLAQDLVNEGFPDWLDVALERAVDSSGPSGAPQRTTIAFTRAQGTRVLEHLRDPDLRFFGDDGLVSSQPVRRLLGNGITPLIESSAADSEGMPDDEDEGLGNALLLELRRGAGGTLFSALDLVRHFEHCSVARALLAGLVEHALAAGTPGAIGAAGSEAGAWLDLWGFSWSQAQPSNYTGFDLLVLDAAAFGSLPSQQVQALRAWVEAGGHLILRRLGAAEQSSLSALLGGTSVQIVPPGGGATRLLLLRRGGLLAGVDQQDLAALAEAGAGVAAVDQVLEFAPSGLDWILASPRSNTGQAAVAQFARGRGLIVVDQTLAVSSLNNVHERRFAGLAAALVNRMSLPSPYGPEPASDRDGDGMFDVEEIWGGLDPLSPVGDDGAGGDRDDDGLANSSELALGLDPSDPDFDLDGLPDGLEVALGLDPFSVDPSYGDRDGDGLWDPLESDPDGDGVSSRMEIAFGTDPLDPGSAPLPPPR